MTSTRITAATMVALLLVTFCARDSYAQKIYLITSADTAIGNSANNDGYAASSKQNESLLKEVFFKNVPTRQLSVYRTEYAREESNESWDGPDLADNSENMEEKILEAIRLCPAGPNDTVIFAYFGHGAYIDEKHSLQMPNLGPSVPRDRFVEAVRAKNTRLAVVMTVSCANIIAEADGRGYAKASEEPVTQISPLFDALFIQASGVVDFNSASKGQFTFGLPSMGGPMMLAMASYETPIRQGDHLRFSSERDLPPYGLLWKHKENRLSWPQFKTLLVSKTDELFQELFPGGAQGQYTQTPHFFSLPSGGGKSNCCCRNRRHGCLKKLMQRIRCKRAQRRCCCRT